MHPVALWQFFVCLSVQRTYLNGNSFQYRFYEVLLNTFVSYTKPISIWFPFYIEKRCDSVSASAILMAKKSIIKYVLVHNNNISRIKAAVRFSIHCQLNGFSAHENVEDFHANVFHMISFSQSIFHRALTSSCLLSARRWWIFLKCR